MTDAARRAEVQELCDLLAWTIVELHGRSHTGLFEGCEWKLCKQVRARITVMRDDVGHVHGVQEIDALLR